LCLYVREGSGGESEREEKKSKLRERDTDVLRKLSEKMRATV
jgi:hypothetical protein